MVKYRGTSGTDYFTLSENEADTVRMRRGNDVVYLSAATFDSEDRIDAGPGVYDSAVLKDGGFYNLGHDRFTGFEQMSLTGHGRFEIYVDDSVGAEGTTFTIYGAGLLSDEFQPSSLFIDWSPERDASLHVYGSSGKDALIGGFRADEFNGQLGNDLITGDEGADRFVFTTEDGGSWGKDKVTDFHTGEDKLIFVTPSVSGFDDLRISDGELGAMIRTLDGSSSVTLYGVLARDLQADDFMFVYNGGPVNHAPAMPHDGGLLV